MKELECAEDYTGEGMSGSSSNEDAKDVMASIRRVIVDEVRDNPMARPQSSHQSSHQSSKPSGAKRLVLGPALRVPSDSQFIPSSTSDTSPSNVVAGSDIRQEDSDAKKVAEHNPTGGAGQKMSSDRPVSASELAQEKTSKKRRELVRARRKEPDPVTETPANVPRQAPVRMPQPAPVSKAAGPVKPLPQKTAPKAAAPARPKPASASSGRREDPSKLETKIAALETLVARSKGQWEPDRPEQDAYAATQDAPMTWDSSDAEPARSADPAPHSPPAEQPNTEMDEAKFRQFVVEIVREELKVQLDIRLNRLVRNIVGREVKRALDKDDAS